MYMKSVFRWIVSGGLACALVAVGLHPVTGQTTKRSGASHEVRRLSVVIGGSVQIADGVSVGKIEDVVLNDRGCIDYVVVVYHDKYVAIPWSVATVDYGERIVTVDITERRFAEVPTFTRTEFSVLTKSDFTQKVRSAFGGKGESTSAKASAQAESAKATKSEGKAEPKETKSEAKTEPTKVRVQDQPKAETKEKLKDQPLDKAVDEPKKPKAESKEKPKDQPRDKAKGEAKDKAKK
jgi:PRC-barrel domain protein